jgi:hypothetical protein
MQPLKLLKRSLKKQSSHSSPRRSRRGGRARIYSAGGLKVSEPITEIQPTDAVAALVHEAKGKKVRSR